MKIHFQLRKWILQIILKKRRKSYSEIIQIISEIVIEVIAKIVFCKKTNRIIKVKESKSMRKNRKSRDQI